MKPTTTSQVQTPSRAKRGAQAKQGAQVKQGAEPVLPNKSPKVAARHKAGRKDVDKALADNLLRKLPPAAKKHAGSVAAGSKRRKQQSSAAASLSPQNNKKAKLSHEPFGSLLTEIPPVPKNGFSIPKATGQAEGVFRDIGHPQKAENSKIFFDFCSNLNEKQEYVLLDGPKMSSSNIINSLHLGRSEARPTIHIPQYSPDDLLEMRDTKPDNVGLTYGKYAEFVYDKKFDSANCFYLDFTGSHRGGVKSRVYPLQDVSRTLEMTPKDEISLSITFSQRRGAASAEKSNHALLHEGKAFEASPKEEAQYQLKEMFAARGFKATKASHVSYGTPSPMSTYFFILKKEEPGTGSKPSFLLDPSESKVTGFKKTNGVITRKILGMNPNYESSYVLSDKNHTKPTEEQLPDKCFDAPNKRGNHYNRI